MEPTDIYKTAHDKWVRVNHYNFSEVDGICTSLGDNKYIWIRSGMDEIEDREILAHELAHLDDWTENIVHIIAEKRAEKGKRELLIPYENLCSAIDEHGEHGIWFLAALFGVKYETMERRMQEVFSAT